MQFSQKVIDRFWAKTTLNHNEWFEGSQCVLWTASHGTKSGRGRFADDSQRFWVAHRFAWTLAHGPVPDGFVVWCRCGRKLCVNEQHFELITESESIRRRIAAWKPSPVFRCCGRARNAENSYPANGRCRACHKVQQRNAPSVKARIARGELRRKRAKNSV